MKKLIFLCFLAFNFVSIKTDFTETECESIIPKSESDCTSLVDDVLSGIVPSINCCYVTFRASGKYYAMCRYLKNEKKDFEDQIKEEIKLMGDGYSDKSIICASSNYIMIKNIFILLLIFILI